MKFISWNIDSLNAALTSTSARALLTRQVLEKIAAEDADIVAIQETKLPAAGMNGKQEAALQAYFPDYECAWVSSGPPARKGYAGTMALYKKSLTVKADFPKIDAPEPMIWDRRYADYLAGLDADKPVIACGDYNVAHKEIDLAHPENNHRSAGFTDEEREGFTYLLSRGFTDTFRHIHGDVEGVYSWWAQRIRTSKINNSGWRIDYFLISDRMKDKVVRSEMMDSGTRQDHAPILLEIADF